MGLFQKRPLALFLLLFLISSLFVYDTSNTVKLWVMGADVILILIVICISFLLKRIQMRLLVAAFCLSAITLSVIHSCIFIGTPVKKAEAYAGENTALCYVIDTVDDNEYNSRYVVKIKRIGDASVNIKAFLTCNFKTDIAEGDEIYGAALIKAERGDSPDQLLTLYMEDPEQCYGRYTSRNKGFFDYLFSDGGFELLSGKLSDFIKTKLFSLLGETKGALAMGFFTGERSDIPSDIARDFKRAGVSHIMAVSGSHIAILLGGIELILRRLGVHKNIRCIVISVLSVGFLFITGFSLSACRAVLMLYSTYIAYYAMESNETVTSLFVSIFIIILVFPHAIVDLGLWMSFLATLGLLTVYPILEEKIPYPRKMKQFKKAIIKVGRELLLIAIMTVVANMFLLPIIWYYFKEFSLVSILANILINFLSSAFLLFVPIMLLVSNIPIVGTAVCWLVSVLAELLISTVRFCSRIPNATVSLKYEFCTYIAIFFTVAMTVMMIINLKKKLFVFLPYVCSVVAFAVCFGVYSLWISVPSVDYVCYDESEIFAVNDNSELSICDSTSGGFWTYINVRNMLKRSYATEIDNYVLTDCHQGHIEAFRLLSQNDIIRTVYVPKPKTLDDVKNAETLYIIAAEQGIEVIFYETEARIKASGDVNMQVTLPDGESVEKHICFWNECKNIVYSSPQYCNENAEYDILIIGKTASSDGRYDLEMINAEEIYISSSELAKRLVLPNDAKKFVPAKLDSGYKISFELD